MAQAFLLETKLDGVIVPHREFATYNITYPGFHTFTLSIKNVGDAGSVRARLSGPGGITASSVQLFLVNNQTESFFLNLSETPEGPYNVVLESLRGNDWVVDWRWSFTIVLNRPNPPPSGRIQNVWLNDVFAARDATVRTSTGSNSIVIEAQNVGNVTGTYRVLIALPAFISATTTQSTVNIGQLTRWNYTIQLQSLGQITLTLQGLSDGAWITLDTWRFIAGSQDILPPAPFVPTLPYTPYVPPIVPNPIPYVPPDYVPPVIPPDTPDSDTPGDEEETGFQIDPTIIILGIAIVASIVLVTTLPRPRAVSD